MSHEPPVRTKAEEIAHEREIAPTCHPAARPFLWLGRRSVKRNFIWLVLAAAIVNSVLGVIFPSKYPAPWETFGDFVVPGSWAIFGFLAYCFIVFMANPLFTLLGRREGFYPGETLPDPDYSTDPAFTTVGEGVLVGKNAVDLEPGEGGSAL